jgi:4-hydroxy-2-oxoglutarate aldolase
MRDLKGVHGPVTTPFRADGELDRGGFERNLAAHFAQGLHGVVVTGSTGEAPLLDERERDQLIAWARPLVPRDRMLIAGIGAESTRVTILRARSVAERGADAALVVAPHYFGSAVTEEGLRAHYSRLADASPIPILLYNIPKYMHFRLSGALVAMLAQHGNIVGIKDSSGAPDSMTEYLAARSESFTVLTGNGQFFRTAMAMGAGGGILAVGLFAGPLTMQVWEAARRGELASAEGIQGRLSPLAKIIVGELGIAGVKAALDAVGLVGGPPRLPLQALSSADLERVHQLLRDAELAVAA